MGDAVDEINTRSTVNEASISLPRPRKRRRTRKACDDCRRRKIKCDGRQPCASCVDFAQECTYTRLVRGTKSGPQYVKELETKVLRLQGFLLEIFPDRDVDDPQFETTIAEQLRSIGELLNDAKKHGRLDSMQIDTNHQEPGLKNDDLLDTMIEVTGQLNIDGNGRCDFHGDFGGLSFLRRMGERCSQLLDADSLKRNMSGQLPLPQASGSARSTLCAARLETMKTYFLPSRAVAIRLTGITLDDACCLMKFIHRPSFDRLLHRVYDLGAESYTSEEEGFLPLLYITLAIGELFSVPQKIQPSDSNVDKVRGARYFRAAESLLDVMDCNDMISLQAIVCIVIYLQAAALMHSCYTYISVAIASALRMGLHQSTKSDLIDPIQQETRRRIFWVLRTMETYVTTLLGIPLITNDHDIDQQLPLEIDDEFITTKGVASALENRTSAMASVNAHTKLLMIMRKVIRDIYPHGTDLAGYHGSYKVNYARVIEVEADLDEWFRNIPQPPPDRPVPPHALRNQLLLRLAHAHVQMVLYRPFIHHIVRTRADDPPEMRSYACASACIKAAMQIIWLVEEMNVQGVFIASYWFTSYMNFFAVLSLCMFILGNTNDLIVDDAITAAEKGRKLLSRLAAESECGVTCAASLEGLLDRMSLHWGKRSRSDPLLNPNDTHAHRAQQGGSKSRKDAQITVAEIGIGQNTTATGNFPPYMPGCNLTSDSVSNFSAPYSEPDQHELLAMVYPMAGGFAIQPELNVPLSDSNELSNENLYAPYFNMSQFPSSTA